MFGLPLAFLQPWILLGLLSLPLIWWLLRLTPPRPQTEVFPPTRILARLQEQEETPAQSPWWLTLLRLAMAAFVIFAMAGPVLNPDETSGEGDGPVLVLVDDGWASGQHWEAMRETALGIVTKAEREGRTVMLESTTGQNAWDGQPVKAADARALLQAAEARPLPTDHGDAAQRLESNTAGQNIGQIHWLSDKLAQPDTAKLIDTLNATQSETILYSTQEQAAAVIGEVKNEPAQMKGIVTRANPQQPAQYEVAAHDKDNVILARSGVIFDADARNAEFSFDQPVELRNQITKLTITSVENAGAVKLLDENNRRRLVGLVSGEAFDSAQPLLSPLYYISRALEPFSDIRRSDDANVVAAVPDLINQGVSVIIMADVGVLPEETETKLEKWIADGGMLVRFAGPRLGSAPQSDLLPVEIRPGDRSLGGALSWETPKPLAAFDLESPFFGLEAPRNVLVNKQLLALQETGLDEKTWSRLEDGTPLVTAEQRSAGWIIFYHVSSDAEWSNLPLSGTFVEMLRRTVNLSSALSKISGEDAEIVLPPLKLLNAAGQFVPPDENTKPLTISGADLPKISAENPPGFYGTEDGVRALNLFSQTPELNTLEATGLVTQFEQRAFATGTTVEFKSWLLLIAAILLLADCIAVLWMSGAMRNTMKNVRPGTAHASVVLASLMLISLAAMHSTAFAQQTDDEDFDYSAALQTRLAYVLTGIDEVDRVSEAGMRGLTHFLTTRTSLEPGEPVGLDVSQDELSFYALIYWPVDDRAELPDPATMARVDAFMKQGGSILFDTRDQISGAFGGTANSPAARTLQLMLSSLDIPPLEPVPSDHVLTKSFYLLDDFPGRFNGGDLWIETSQNRAEEDGRPARSGDGVSSILITSNDFAGAWAVDSGLRPLLPTVPPDPGQRTYAFRSGVNLMMYALTGNYKADQVHLPALLERLGQ